MKMKIEMDLISNKEEKHCIIENVVSIKFIENQLYIGEQKYSNKYGRKIFIQQIPTWEIKNLNVEVLK